MNIPTATVSGDNLCLLRDVCRKRIADIAAAMRRLHVSDYASEFDYEYAMLGYVCDIRDITAIYLELNNTTENK